MRPGLNVLSEDMIFDDKGRFACWRQVADAGRILAEDFLDAVRVAATRDLVKPAGNRLW